MKFKWLRLLVAAGRHGNIQIGLMPAHVAAQDIKSGILEQLSWQVPLGEGRLASPSAITRKCPPRASALHIARAFQDASLPDGMLHLVVGSPATFSAS